MTKEIKHGSSEPFKLSISKDKNFKEDINLNATVAQPNKGVTATVEPSKLTGAEASEFTVTVKAADDAQEGEYTVNVVATPTGGGKETSLPFKVKVPAKK